MAVTIDERTNAPLGFIASIVSGAVALALIAGGAHYRLASLEHRLETTEAALMDSGKMATIAEHQYDLRLQRLEDNYSRILQSLSEISSSVKELQERPK